MRPIFEPCENWHYYQKNKCHYDCLWSRNRIINKRPEVTRFFVPPFFSAEAADKLFGFMC